MVETKAVALGPEYDLMVCPCGYKNVVTESPALKCVGCGERRPYGEFVRIVQVRALTPQP